MKNQSLSIDDAIGYLEKHTGMEFENSTWVNDATDSVLATMDLLNIYVYFPNAETPDHDESFVTYYIQIHDRTGEILKDQNADTLVECPGIIKQMLQTIKNQNHGNEN